MTHTPETIRALLDGITAGEWTVKYIGGTHKSSAQIHVFRPFHEETPVHPNDASFIRHSPGIARYALDLAAERERLRGMIEECEAALTECRHDDDEQAAALLWREVVIEVADEPNALAARDIARRALAPQPAPTDGVELRHDS